jgi:diguanylate cyclase (GGDEF)-like protein/PAS domain S-box-containing protein
MLIPSDTDAPRESVSSSPLGRFFTEFPAGEQSLLLDAIAQTRTVLELAPDGQALRANPIFLELFGYTAEQLRQCHHQHFLTAEDAASADYQLLWQALRQGQVLGGEYRRVAADGRIIWLQATYTPIFDDSGALTKIIEMASDVTSRVEEVLAEREQAQILAHCVEKSDCAMLVTDRVGKVLYYNDALTELLGYSLDEVLGSPEALLTMPPQTQAFWSDFQCKLLGIEPYQTTELIHTRTQQPLWCSLTVNPVLDPRGRLLNAISVFTDITETKIYGLLQYKALEAMARDVPLEQVMQLICEEVENIAPEVVASILRVDDQGILHPLAAPSLPIEYCQALDGTPIGLQAGSCGSAAFRAEPVLVRDIANDPLWAHYKDLALPLGLLACWSTPIIDNDGRVVATFAFYYREIRGPNEFHQHLVAVAAHLCTLALEREASRDTIHQLAYYDALTGLPNRRTLLDQANHAIAQAERDGTSLAVMFIDLDRFKQVNDSLGHPAGDSLLRTIAQRLRSQMRTYDIVGRLAGDEFVMVLTHCDMVDVSDILDRVQHQLALPEQHDGITVTPSASIGISLYPQDGQDMETLLHHADLAMYQAKNSGHGQIRFFTSEMNQLAQQRMSLEAALREALRSQQLELHYQPQVDLRTGRLHGVEALARWHHPLHGQISPTRFIPLAEECGLIRQLGQWVLNESCRQLSATFTMPTCRRRFSPP